MLNGTGLRCWLIGILLLATLCLPGLTPPAMACVDCATVLADAHQHQHQHQQDCPLCLGLTSGLPSSLAMGSATLPVPLARPLGGRHRRLERPPRT
jgi:hypothetical protein